MAVIQTLQSPARYTREQLDKALKIATLLDRGRLVLCEPPAR